MRYDVVLIRSDEGYAVHCPALPPCWSQGATREEALENIRDAIAEYLDYRGEKAAELIAEARREGCRVAPGRARAYAKAMGQAAKTDPLDARRLARRPPRVAARVRERNRLEQGKSFAVKDFRFRHLDWLDREIEQRERQYKKLLESSQFLDPQAQLYCSVRGVGIHTAAILLAWLPERGRGDGKSLTALAGLAPWPKDSGKQQGYRAIKGGRSVVRRALSRATLTALRRKDNDLSRFYYRLRERSKPGKGAMVAAMRKLLLPWPAIARRGTPGTPPGVPN